METARYGDILSAGNKVLNERNKVEHILESQHSKEVKHKYDLNSFKDEDYIEDKGVEDRDTKSSQEEEDYDGWLYIIKDSDKKIAIAGVIGIVIIITLIVTFIII